MNFTEYDFTYNQFDVAKDITSGTVSLEDYLDGFKYERDNIEYLDANEVESYRNELDELYKEARAFADKLESKMYEISNILVADNYDEFFPIGKSDVFEFVD